MVMTGASSRPYNPLLRVFTVIDLGFVIRIVLSLVAIFLGFDAVNGEKERRTLSLLLSNPISRLRFLAGKFMGGMVVLGVLLTAGFLLVAINLAASFDVNLNGSLLGELTVIWGASLFYLATFFSLSLLISTLTHESSTSLVILLLIWALGVLLRLGRRTRPPLIVQHRLRTSPRKLVRFWRRAASIFSMRRC